MKYEVSAGLARALSRYVAACVAETWAGCKDSEERDAIYDERDRAKHDLMLKLEALERPQAKIMRRKR